LSAHRRALEFGGRPGIPNPELVESAIARPYNGYYRRIEQKAAALVQSMATNHGFADGNKRTTVILLHTMLTRSGYRLEAIASDRSIDHAVENIVLAVIFRRIAFRELVEWLDVRIRPD
jgi:death-on-curing protein